MTSPDYQRLLRRGETLHEPVTSRRCAVVLASLLARAEHCRREPLAWDDLGPTARSGGESPTRNRPRRGVRGCEACARTSSPSGLYKFQRGISAPPLAQAGEERMTSAPQARARSSPP